jgi:dUTP pyrophosphatase
MEIIMNFYKMRKNVIAPTRATEGSACYDLYSCTGEKGLRIPAGGRVKVPTGLILEIPEQHVVKVFARSSVSYKRGLVLCNSVGIIDHDYREELFLLFWNTTNEDVIIEHGERLAQMMLEKVMNYDLVETTERPAILESRDGGIGSTGVK